MQPKLLAMRNFAERNMHPRINTSEGFNGTACLSGTFLDSHSACTLGKRRLGGNILVCGWHFGVVVTRLMAAKTKWKE